jgi:hypothetical protein
MQRCPKTFRPLNFFIVFTSFLIFERCCVPLSLCLYYIILFYRPVILR